jgi:ABC-type nitrate/sulfonate/bicarbonate transport system substrate-binding protein
MARSSLGIQLVLGALLFAGAAAHAGSTSEVVAQGAGYQTTYEVALPSTLNGNDVTHAVLLESDGAGNVLVDSGHTLSPGGRTVLSHSVSFLPTSALLIGLELPEPNAGDGKTHIAMWVDEDFAAAAKGKSFSVAFPHSRHSLFIDNFLRAAGGDSDALDALLEFFTVGDGASAAFTPGGEFTLIFSTTIVPEPGTALLVASGVGLALRAWRRRG